MNLIMCGKSILKYIYIQLALSLILSAPLFVSCKDESIDIQGSGSTEEYEDAPEMTLSFPVLLDRIASTRASQLEEIENYINPSMVTVLFFNSDGEFIFEGKDFKLTETVDHNGQYYLQVPLTNNSVTDSENKSILSLVKSHLETNDFKIAILANWATGTNKPYDLGWGWKNSILYKEKYDNSSDEDKAVLASSIGAPDLKSINDLHHLEEDSYYSDNSRKSAYTYILDDQNRLGFNTEWVEYRDINGKELNGDPAWHNGSAPTEKFSSTTTAYTWIKKYWDPSKDNLNPDEVTEHTIYRHYARLWQLWNFGGGFSDNVITYSNLGADTFENEWKERNANEFAISEDEAKSQNKDYWFYWDNHWFSNGQTLDGLTIVTKENDSDAADDTKIRSYNGTDRQTGKTGFYGIVLPTMNSKAVEDANPSNQSKHKPWIKQRSGFAWEYLKFTAPGTGKLRVYCSTFDGNPATLILQRGTNWEMTYQLEGTDLFEIGAKDSKKTNEGLTFPAYSTDKNVGYTVKLTSGPEDIILFSYEGSVIIHAIEFVCDDYLAGTDRQGKKPSTGYPIPMYGVQDFKSIDSWGTQEVLNLPNTIYLIRALAKVELYLPNGKEFSHVYMRSMNRKARCETMDVSTPTYNLWKSHGDGEGDCEWFTIQKHGSGLNKNYEWYYWFHGAWQDFNWPGLQGKSLEKDPPRLFNPDVQRSDFCHFLKDDDYVSDIYDRYYLYVPDKAISDPNSEGDLTSSSKVCHIEYRHSDQTDYLDDNNCYRIYFTDYANNPVIKNMAPDDYESKYEGDASNLDYNWPIMRNHIYRFYVEGNNTAQEVRVKVLPWGDTLPKKEVW